MNNNSIVSETIQQITQRFVSPVLGTKSNSVLLMTIRKLDTKVFFGQKAFIERGRKVLVLRDPLALISGQSGLDFPGGKYRWSETLENGLRREVREETSLEIEIVRPFFVWTSHRLRLKINSQPMVYVGYLCKYKSGEVKLSKEHIEFKWVDKSTYKKWQDRTEDFEALETYFKLKKGLS